MNSDVRQLLGRLSRLGYGHQRDGGGHWLITSPEGRKVGRVPFSPSDWRALKNIVAKLRRNGVPI